MKKVIILVLAVMMILSVFLIANAKTVPQKSVRGNAPAQQTTATATVPESEIIETEQPDDEEDPEKDLPDEEDKEQEDEEEEEKEEEEQEETDQDPEAQETEKAPAEETETAEPTAAEGDAEAASEAEEEAVDDHVYDDVIVTIEGVQMTVNYDGADHIVSGYTVTDISHGEYGKNDFVFVGKAEAVQRDAGVAWMGLNSEMFINKNDRFTSVSFDVTDGFIEVLPATAEIEIVGAGETFEYDGNSHSVEGFEMIQLRPAGEKIYTRESFEMVGNASDFAEGTEVGRYPMGLNGGSFRNIDPNFSKVIFLVMDGYVEIYPSAEMMEEPEEIEEPEETPEITEEPAETEAGVPAEALETTEEPVQEETEVPAEEPDATEEPVQEETEVPAEEPDATEEPVEGETEVPAEKPETTENSVEEKTEVPAEEPETTEEPVEGETEVPGEEPEATEEPVEGETEVPAEEPEVTEESVESETEVPAEEPEATGEPLEGETEVPAEEPEATGEPVEGETEVPAETPETTGEPVEGETEVTAETPEATGEPVEGESEKPAEEAEQPLMTAILPAGTAIYAAPDAAADVLNVLTKTQQVTLNNIDENGWAEILLEDETSAYVFLTNNEDPETEAADSTGILLLAGTDIREKPSGMSGIIATLEEDTEAAYLGISGRWVMVRLPDETTGFIYYGDINDADIEAPAPGRQVIIFTSRRSVMEFGEPIYLTSVLEGFDDVEDIHYQWECNKGEGYEPVEGATEDHYSYIADPDSISWGWRLVISFEEED